MTPDGLVYFEELADAPTPEQLEKLLGRRPGRRVPKAGITVHRCEGCGGVVAIGDGMHTVGSRRRLCATCEPTIAPAVPAVAPPAGPGGQCPHGCEVFLMTADALADHLARFHPEAR